MKTAQRRGVKFGRKVKLTPEQIDHSRKLPDKGEARQYVAYLLNVGRFDALLGVEVVGTAVSSRGCHHNNAYIERVSLRTPLWEWLFIAD